MKLSKRYENLLKRTLLDDYRAIVLFVRTQA
jgi:hypothetical protein